jgi:8-oxo-dGTP pyrophosphatase MutT (NUDIX family)
MIAFEKSVGAVVFRKENNKIYYLLLNYISGHWDFPKGHIEKGETNEETMRRELQEETGLEDLVVLPNFSGSYLYYYQAKGDEYEKRKAKGKKTLILKKVTFYLTKTDTKEIKISKEHIGFEWLSFEKALEKITYKNPKKVLEKAKRFLDKSGI